MHITKLITGIKEGRYLELGSSGLMLNIITPLKKLSKGGTTINDVVQQRYQDLFHRPMTSSLLKVIEESFTRKEVNIRNQNSYGLKDWKLPLYIHIKKRTNLFSNLFLWISMYIPIICSNCYCRNLKYKLKVFCFQNCSDLSLFK